MEHKELDSRGQVRRHIQEIHWCAEVQGRENRRVSKS